MAPPTRYDWSRLRELAATCATFKEIAVAMGMANPDKLSLRIRKVAAQQGVDVAHLRNRTRVPGHTAIKGVERTPEELAAMVARCTNWGMLGRELGLAHPKSQRTTLFRLCERHGLSTAHFHFDQSAPRAPRTAAAKQAIGAAQKESWKARHARMAQGLTEGEERTIVAFRAASQVRFEGLLRGVHVRRYRGETTWAAILRRQTLGSYHSPQEAAQAYDNAVQELGGGRPNNTPPGIPTKRPRSSAPRGPNKGGRPRQPDVTLRCFVCGRVFQVRPAEAARRRKLHADGGSCSASCGNRRYLYERGLAWARAHPFLTHMNLHPSHRMSAPQPGQKTFASLAGQTKQGEVRHCLECTGEHFKGEGSESIDPRLGAACQPAAWEKLGDPLPSVPA